MTETKRPLKVFLCHAHADRDVVRGLYSRLTADGVDVWLDKEKLVGGQNFEFEIRKAVRESDLVIVCLSKEFNKTGFRQKEIKWAIDTAMEKPEGEIFIVPVRLEESETLESIRHLHWIDLFEDDGYQKLTGALSLRAEKVNAIFRGKTDLKRDVSSLIENYVDGQFVLSALGSARQKMGDFAGAIEYYEQALKLSEEIGDRKTQATILSNLSSAYERVGDLVVASEYLQHALDIAAEVDSDLRK